MQGTQDFCLSKADPTDLASLEAALQNADPDNKLQPILMKDIIIRHKALELLPEVISSLTKGKKLLMVTDVTQMFRGDESVKEKVYSILTQGHSVRWLVLHNKEEGKDLHADDHNSKMIQDAIADADCVVGVGGGTITDLCKDAVHEFNKELPLVIVQTVLSVNAFSDGVSVMLKHGVKRTVPSIYPTVLIIDLDVVKRAPLARNLSGYGDLMATWTAPADWFLAHQTGMNANYHTAPYEILREQNYELMEQSAQLKNMNEGTLNLLAKVLTVSGLAMGIAGESSPASGTEHIITHLVDMSADSRGQNVAYHGAQVAIGAIITSIAWEIFLQEFDPSKLDVEKCYPDAEKMKKMVHEAFQPIDPDGNVCRECWRDYEKKLAKWNENKERFKSLLANWGDFKIAIKKFLLSPDYLCKCMHAAGAPTRYRQMNPPIDAKTVRWAILSCHLFRNRFTLADLLFYTGWWNKEFVERLLARAEELGAGI